MSGSSSAGGAAGQTGSRTVRDDTRQGGGLSDRSGRSRIVRGGLGLAMVVLLVIVAVVVAGPGRDAPPLDLRSTAGDGLKALVDTLRELDADVAITRALPGRAESAALVVIDRLGDEERVELEAWVDAGGVLVVTDPGSDLTPRPIGGAGASSLTRLPAFRECDHPALDGVSEVVPASVDMVYEAPGGSIGCFPRNDGHWLVVTPRGDGAIVALGGPLAFTNAELGRADHSVLAAVLLAPERGTRTALLRPPRPGEGGAAPTDLVDPRVWWFLLQLVVAFLLVVGWRVRRHGRPVDEPQPVDIPASELVRAHGHLLHEQGQRKRAAAVLRADLRRRAAHRLGVPTATGDSDLAALLADRSGVDRDRAWQTLGGPEPADEAALVELARAVASVDEQMRPRTASADRQDR